MWLAGGVKLRYVVTTPRSMPAEKKTPLLFFRMNRKGIEKRMYEIIHGQSLQVREMPVISPVRISKSEIYGIVHIYWNTPLILFIDN
ncbi:MAG TPA: hypothetical protein PLQ41_00180 [bacterium]|nr:hypothetical protein [bacterium]